MDPITVALEQKGAEDVSAALRDVQDSIAALDAFSAKSGRSASRDRVRVIREEASERRKAAKADTLAARVRESRSRASSGFDRALGGNGGRASVSRASSGPSMGEFAGLASSSVGSLMGTVGKFGAIGGAIALFKTGLDLATSALETFGGFLISDVVKPAFALETAAVQLENSTGGKFKAADAMATARAQGLRHNVAADSALASIKTLIDKGFGGDIESAKQVNDAVLTISKSRGIGADALAKYAAEIKGTFKTASADSIASLLATQIAQGDEGSVTIEELSRLGGRIVAPAASLGGTDDSRLAQIGAVMQATKSGFGSADELATGVGNLITHFATTTDERQKKMFQLQDGPSKGQVADLGNVFGNVYRLTGGDASKMVSMLGIGATSPEMKALLSQKETFTKAGGGEAGAQAIEDAIRSFQEMTSSLDRERENERKVLQTSGEKWNAAIEKLKDKMLSIMPEVQKLVDSLIEYGPAFGSALEILAQVLIGLANTIASSSVLRSLFGIKDEKAVDTDATGQAQGKYRMNLETGQFEWVKQSQLNKEAEADPFSDKFDPAKSGVKFKMWDGSMKPSDANAEGNASTAANVSTNPFALPGAGAPSGGLNISLPGLSSAAPPAEQSSGPGSTGADAALASLDALAPKAQKLGLMFDKLAVAGNDVARTKPLSQR